MKFVTPEISWHGRDPLYGVDFQCGVHDIRRFATCGTDQIVRIWQLTHDSELKAAVKFLANLQRHSRTVNVVRFSPDGTFLASGGDDAVIMLWKHNPLPPEATLFKEEDEEESVENWTVQKYLRSHLEDVYDLSWSQCGNFMVSGSVDNTAILWDVGKGAKIKIFSEAKSFVQGVAYDPQGLIFATMSADRKCRIYNIKSKKCVNAISKQTVPVDSNSNQEEKATKMFHDDSLKSFFRRLVFSPDGQLLITPAGCLENGNTDETVNTSYMFSRHNFTKPVCHMPGPKKPTIVIRCSPILYKLREIKEKIFDLPYRMIFAVATEDSVLLYDTQQTLPVAYFSNIHYHTLSDLTWSPDGQVLIVASTDGYCTIITFEKSELGELYEEQLKLPVDDSSKAKSPLETTKVAKVECQSNEKAKEVPEKDSKVTQDADVKMSDNSQESTSNSGAESSGKPARRVQTTVLSADSSVAALSISNKTDSKEFGETSKPTSNPTEPAKTTVNSPKPRRILTTLIPLDAGPQSSQLPSSGKCPSGESTAEPIIKPPASVPEIEPDTNSVMFATISDDQLCLQLEVTNDVPEHMPASQGRVEGDEKEAASPGSAKPRRVQTIMLQPNNSGE